MLRTCKISNSDDTIDVRDVIALFEELDSEKELLECALTDANDELADALSEQPPIDSDVEMCRDAMINATEALNDWPDAEEFAALKSLLEDLRGNGGDEQWRGDWYPITLIRHSYFVDAMCELCEDIGDMPRDGFPSYMVIDWEKTAENLRADYTSTDFDGVEYWYR